MDCSQAAFRSVSSNLPSTNVSQTDNKGTVKHVFDGTRHGCRNVSLNNELVIEVSADFIVPRV